MTVRNKNKFRFDILPAYTGPFRALSGTHTYHYDPKGSIYVTNWIEGSDLF